MKEGVEIKQQCNIIYKWNLNVLVQAHPYLYIYIYI